MSERIEWEAVPGDAPEWCARWGGLHLSVWKHYRDGWAWSARRPSGSAVNCGTVWSEHAAALQAAECAARCVGPDHEVTLSPILPSWPYAATDADPRGEDVPCVVRADGEPPADGEVRAFAKALAEAHAKSQALRPVASERFAASPGSRVPTPSHVEAQPWVHGGHIVPADIDGVVEMAMKAFEPAQTARVGDRDFPVPLPAPDPDFAAITDVLGLPRGMTAAGVAAAARNLRAQRDRLERELAEAERMAAHHKAQFDRLWQSAEAAHTREDALRCDLAAERREVDRLREYIDALERAEATVAPAKASKPRPPVCFKMPGDATDGRTFAACDDPTRHLDADD